MDLLTTNDEWNLYKKEDVFVIYMLNKNYNGYKLREVLKS